jgi:hypothetical protein
MHERTIEPLDRFSWNLILETYEKLSTYLNFHLDFWDVYRWFYTKFYKNLRAYLVIYSSKRNVLRRKTLKSNKRHILCIVNFFHKLPPAILETIKQKRCDVSTSLPYSAINYDLQNRVAITQSNRNLYWVSIYLWLYSPLLDVGCFFSFLIFYTAGRSPWTGDQPVASPLPAHSTAETQNKRTQTSMPQVWFEPTIQMFKRAKTVHIFNRAATMIGFILCIDSVKITFFFIILMQCSRFISFS